MSTLERAIEIARKAHEGQSDKGGAPYITHPLRVMERVGPEEAKMAAVLHDVVEDTEVTLDDLRAEGFPEKIVEAVDALTRRPGEPYELFIFRAASNDIARTVKMADLIENCDLSRIPNPGPEDFERLKKYQHAIQVIRCMFSDPPTPEQQRPNLPKGSEIIAEAGFKCSACEREAGRIFLIRIQNEYQLCRESFTGSLTTKPVLDETSLETLLQAFRSPDARAFYETDFELAPFYCPKCDACYCGQHYQRWDVFDEDMPMFHDCIMGRCPKGHQRMLED